MVDAVIVLYESTEKTFVTNGLGGLGDAISCTVTEELNGKFELELLYPITGIHYAELELRRLILAKPNPYSDPQPFRIYSISTPIDGIVVVDAEHISYDLSGYVASPFYGWTAPEAIDNFIKALPVDCPFKFDTTLTNDDTGGFTSEYPRIARSIMGGGESSFISAYKCEYEYDVFDVHIKIRRGKNRGVSIVYGKNLTDFSKYENCDNLFTGVEPYWSTVNEKDEVDIYELPERVVPVPRLGPDGKPDPNLKWDYTRVYLLDATHDFSEKPKEEDLRKYATDFIEQYKLGVPKVNFDIAFVPLSQMEEYKNYAVLETVYLGDTVNVAFPEIGVNAVARCIRTVYDCVANKYASIELGDAREGISNTIVDQQNNLDDTPSFGDIDDAVDDALGGVQEDIDHATDLITGNVGGYVVLKKNATTGKPEEILVMDTEDINTARSVWRWNNSGLGFSGTGYNGEYRTAMTSDGKINADFIATGTLKADYIKSGVIAAKNGKFSFDLNNGTVKMEELKILTEFKEDVEGNGVSKVHTGLGLDISKSSIDIFNPDSDSNLTNSLNETGMFVIYGKGSDDERIMLQATKDGVIATDLTALNYLIVANKIRFQKYRDDMIGCYWIGG